MIPNLTGTTRIVPIVGDPIAQVKSPAGVTAAFAARGIDAICVPINVSAADFEGFIHFVRGWRNCDGVIVTVPHKQAAASACDKTSERSAYLGCVNTIRRAADGTLAGDMFDGIGFVTACRDRGCTFNGKRALLLGAGGAGSAIAHAVATTGVAALAIADVDEVRRDHLVARLAALRLPVVAARADTNGFDIVLNATPLGMRLADPLPLSPASLHAGMFVGDVVTGPDPTPLIAAARAARCATCTGIDMFANVRDLMIDFLLAGR